MATDNALLVAGQGNLPLSYTVPNAQEIIVLSARAVIDGSGAGSAYLPVLQLVSDAGVILAEAITDASVAAGASAQVSWFPGVKSAAAASSTTTFARAWGINFAGQTVTAGTTKNCSFDTVRTSDATQIQWSTTTVLNDTFKIMTTGWALISASCQWPAGTLVDYRIDSPGGFELYQHDAITAFSKQGSDFTVGLPTMMDSVWIDSTAAAGTQFRVRMTNNDAANSGPDTAMVAIMFFPGLSL